jgi:hypothetical protein
MSSQTETQQAYQIPAKPYYLVPTVRPLEEICAVTYNLTFVSEEFRNTLFFRVGNRPWPTTFGMFNAPTNINALKMVIGEDGYFLKLTTRACDVDMIWHDRQNNMFLFWGPSIYAVVQAMNQIRSRIIKYTIYVNPEQSSIQPVQEPQEATAQPQEAYEEPAQVVPQRTSSIQPQEAYAIRQDGIEDISDDEDDDFDDMPYLVDSDGNIVN